MPLIDNNQTMKKSTTQTTEKKRIKPPAELAVKGKAEDFRKARPAENDCDDEALAPFVGALFRTITEADDRQIVIVCFGTTAISGDSLGPQVGSLLRDRYNVPAFVYGTEERTVNGKNMAQWVDFIRSVHEDALIIAVDASLGQADKVGQIVLRTDGVCPAAIKGRKNRFGDVGILGVVAESGEDPLMQLMTVSPVYVQDLAHKVCVLLNQALFA